MVVENSGQDFCNSRFKKSAEDLGCSHHFWGCLSYEFIDTNSIMLAVCPCANDSDGYVETQNRINGPISNISYYFQRIAVFHHTLGRHNP